ncbi:MAG: shikimate dehydrogenase [Gemmatimonadota bacterium]|nr:MAG: shikimate dehydrogenase [Gemmatimonadota bacterium]
MDRPLYALLGAPVHHSLSPALQNAAIDALEIDAVYVALWTWEDLVGPLMRSLPGGNVTVPHKRAAAAALDHPSEDVRATGACNVFWWDESRGLCGDNTDAGAFRTAAEALLKAELTGCRVLLLGAGGAARAVVHACCRAGVDRVEILNRTRARAEELVADVGAPGAVRVLEGGEGRSEEAYDLVVNATSLGLDPSDPLPVKSEAVQARALLDLVYGRDETPLVRAARAAGIEAADGRLMLLEQAILSFRRWFDRDPPREVMLRVVRLGE